MAHDDNTDILNTSTGSVQSTFRRIMNSMTLSTKRSNPLPTTLSSDQMETTLLVPLEGLLHLPVADPNKKFPCLSSLTEIIRRILISIPVQQNPDAMARAPDKGVVKFALRTNRVPSYTGYEILQLELAGKGIASYSINLNIVNDLENNEAEAFDRVAMIAANEYNFFCI